jgi:hypothetical protein
LKLLSLLIAAALALAFLPGCASGKDASAREWQRAECNRIIDKDDRERCLKRL